MVVLEDEPLVINGKLVMPGLFQLHDQEGLHLADGIRLCKANNAIPGLPEFCCDAASAGWEVATIMRVVREGMVDSGLYCRAEIERFLPRLEAIAWNHAMGFKWENALAEIQEESNG